MVTIRGATEVQIQTALNETSAVFGGNIIFNRGEKKGNAFFVTLKVKDSHGKGARVGFSGKAVCAACWHVYGTFFDKVFEQAPAAVIVSLGRRKITKDSGNWIDQDIGSYAKPLKYSEACRCSENGLLEEMEI